MEDYPCSCIEDKINGKDVTILGVFHTEPFLWEHYSFLQSHIKKADALVIEQVVGGASVIDSFFGSLAAMAVPNPVYVVDPINEPLFFTDTALGFLGFYLMAFPPLRYASRFIAKKMYSKTNTSNAEKSSSRRDFLKGILKNTAIIGAGASLFSGSLTSSGLKEMISEDIFLNYDTEDVLSYGSTDFRNILIAEGLHKIIATQKENKIIAIHGDAHSKPIHYYLTHPAFRAKRLAYLPLELISKGEVKRYQCMGFDWRLAETLPF